MKAKGKNGAARMKSSVKQNDLAPDAQPPGEIMTTNQGLADQRRSEFAQGRSARSDAARRLSFPGEDHSFRS